MNWLKKLIFTIQIIVTLFFPTSIFAATLALDPNSVSVGQGCNFSVNVLLDTQGADTSGTDVILLYDPQALIASTVTTANLYPNFPSTNIDNNLGKITISGLSAFDKPYNGKGTFATVALKTLSSSTAGPASLNFGFDPNNPGKTTDSNVIDKNTQKNILTSVTNSTITINTGSCIASKLASLAPSPSTIIPSSSQLPNSGIVEDTYLMLIIGLGLIVIGFLGIKFHYD